jgi:hypothetical protein
VSLELEQSQAVLWSMVAPDFTRGGFLGAERHIRRGGGGVDAEWGRSRIRGMMKAASPWQGGKACTGAGLHIAAELQKEAATCINVK